MKPRIRMKFSSTITKLSDPNFILALLHAKEEMKELRREKRR